MHLIEYNGTFDIIPTVCYLSLILDSANILILE